MKNKQMFMEYMTLLGEMHKTEITKILKDAYWKLLEPHSDEVCERVFKILVNTCRFWPKPPDFTDLLNGTPGNKAHIAWMAFYSALKEIGPYRSIKFPDPVIHSVVDAMGGWPLQGSIENKDIKWTQKRFFELYESYSKIDNHPEYLPGIHEENNLGRFSDFIKPPLLYGGDERKQLQEGE